MCSQGYHLRLRDEGTTMKRFLVAIAKSDGGVELYPMKEWLRQHPENIPSGLDATQSTSHQLRDALKRQGWIEQTSDTEVWVSPRSSGDSIEAVPSLGPAETDETEIDDSSAPAETVFSLESQLRDFIAANMEAIQVNGRRLKLYVDAAGVDGVEYQTAVGRIDILAQDVETGGMVVFELKRGRSPDHVIGQIARYMGWLKSTIAKEGDVSGVVVAKQITENLRYAVAVVPGVSLFEYEVSFRLNAIKSHTL